MILGVISDTHDAIANTQYALDELSKANVNAIVHCGDWKTVETAREITQYVAKLSLPFYGVLGNRDIDSPRFLALNRPGVSIVEGAYQVPDSSGTVVYHGHHAPTLRKLREDDSITSLLLGHTHKPKIERVGQRVIANPGSLAFSIPRSKDWRPSYAIVDTEKRSAELYYFDRQTV